MCVVYTKRGRIELAIVIESKVYIIFVLLFLPSFTKDMTVCFWLFDCTNLLRIFVRPICSHWNMSRRFWADMVRSNRRLQRTSAFEWNAEKKILFWNVLNCDPNYCNRLSVNCVFRFFGRIPATANVCIIVFPIKRNFSNTSQTYKLFRSKWNNMVYKAHMNVHRFFRGL